jgi:hypothetical protein
MTPAALDLNGKSRDDLLKLKALLELEIGAMRTKIQQAQVRARQIGDYASPAWWGRVHQARRALGRQVQQVQLELGRLKTSRAKSVAEHFLDVCRERMGNDPNFKVYLETAKRRAL